jgi:hypothetical protein
VKRPILLAPVCAGILALAGCSAGSSSAQDVDDVPASSATTATTADGAVATVATTCSADLDLEAHYDATDLEWDASSAVEIGLDGTTATAGEGVTVDGSTVTITAPGTYVVSGELTDGRLVVDTAVEGTVQVVLDGATIHSATSAPFSVTAADEVVVILADGSANALSDEAGYEVVDADGEPNAALFSAADLTIAGSGSLTVEAAENDGIASQDGLVIAGGSIEVTAVDDGIRGKDQLIVRDGTVEVTAGGDALKADNAEEEGRGYVAVLGGRVDLTAGADGIDAATQVSITGGTTVVEAGGGSSAQPDSTTSTKGIKGSSCVSISDGTVEVDSADDALHSNGTVDVSGGSVALATGDDAVHADAAVTVSGGEVVVTDSYEGLESAAITIAGGSTDITSSDDGINAVGGNDGSGTAGPGGGGDSFSSSSGAVTISGGTLLIDAGGDGLDSNGSITMTDGLVLVNGPTQNGNGPLDYNGTYAISGGTLVATGSAGMAMAPSSGSDQGSLLATFTSQSAGTLVTVRSADGDVILSFAPSKAYASIAVSTPALEDGVTYEIVVGGTTSATATDGLSEGGSVSGGDVVAETTTDEAVSQQMGPGGGGAGMRPGG